MHSNFFHNNKKNGVDWEALLKTAVYFQAHYKAERHCYYM